jgi:NADH-ubiquinone oxidoreductase chain 6
MFSINFWEVYKKNVKMHNMYVLVFENYKEYLSSFLDLFSALAVLCAILTIINKNPIVSVLFLICLFILISGYLIFIGMNFIGISYLLVYIGAVSILFLFILMLINIRISEIQTETSNSLPLTVLISIAFYSIVYGILPYLSSIKENNVSHEKHEEINYALSSVWDNNIAEVLHITSIGNVLYTNYFIWLILASVILLLAMVGAIIITIKHTALENN